MAHRTVLRPSSTGARAIAEWAIDLWPYVNGKALVNGLQLASMEVDDMLDVIHYFMEEDFNVTSAEQSEAREKSRTILYKSLYNKDYRFSSNKKTFSTVDASGHTNSFEEELVPVDPTAGPTKSYVPPTDFNPESIKPFGDVLDAPFEL
jgi:hypothetical protein